MRQNINAFIYSKINSQELRQELKNDPQLLESCNLVRLTPEQILFQQKSIAENAFFVLEGSLRITAKRGDFERTLAIVSNGDLGGALLMNIDTAYYPGCVIAITNAVVLLIPKRKFLTWNKNAIAAKYINTCIQERVEKTQHDRIFAEATVEVRLAQFLIYHLLKKADLCGKKITRRQISLIIGTKTETTIRTLRQFEKLGLILARQSTYRILNEAELRKIAKET